MILATSRTNTLLYVLKIALAICILTAAAKITVPFWPVPMTLQTVAILTIAGVSGLRFSTETLTGYLAIGAAGLPVFAGTPEKGIGLAYMFGPTGGYLLGFLLAAMLVGFVADRFGKKALIVAIPVASALIYAPGLAWLAQFVPSDKVLAFGITPFVAGDVFKAAIAIMLCLAAPVALTRWIKGAAE